MEKNRFDETYGQVFGFAPPQSMTRGESDADIFSEGRGFMGGFDLTMQIQVGCPAGCLFCYVKSRPFFAPPEVRGPNGSRWGFAVRDKRAVVEKLTKHLRIGRLADKRIYWSGVTDPYASRPVISRAVWDLLVAAPPELRPHRIAVQTRFRPDRDADAMAQYIMSTFPSDQGPPVIISYSIGTDRNDLIRRWERGTPSFESRLKVVKNLRAAGIPVVVTLSPLAAWNDLRGTLEHFKALGVAYITCLFFKDNCQGATTPRHFVEYLRREHPLLLDPAWQQERLAEVRGVFGNAHVLVGQEGFTSLAKPQDVGRVSV